MSTERQNVNVFEVTIAVINAEYCNTERGDGSSSTDEVTDLLENKLQNYFSFKVSKHV